MAANEWRAEDKKTFQIAISKNIRLEDQVEFLKKRCENLEWEYQNLLKLTEAK